MNDMKIENIKKGELIIKEINALDGFIKGLTDNGTTSDQLFFGNSETGTAELKVVFKGKTLQTHTKDLKYLVFKDAQAKLKELKESLIEL